MTLVPPSVTGQAPTGIIRAMRSTERSVESHPELFRTEEWSLPRGTRTATWIAITAGAFFGPLISDLSGLSMGEELPFMALFVVFAFAACFLQALVLRRGGAKTEMRWFESNVLRIFVPIESQGKVERSHFAAAGAIPTVLLLLLLAGYLAVVPHDALGLAVTVLAGAGSVASVKELFYTALALRRPQGTLVEELEGGAVRFHEPTFPRP